MMIFCGARTQGANCASFSAIDGPFAASAFCRPARFLPAITSSVLIFGTTRIRSPIFTPSPPLARLQSVSDRGSNAGAASAASISLLAIAAAPTVLSNVLLVEAMSVPQLLLPRFAVLVGRERGRLAVAGDGQRKLCAVLRHRQLLA